MSADYEIDNLLRAWRAGQLDAEGKALLIEELRDAGRHALANKVASS